MLWASEQQAANIVLRGARVLDPAEGIDAILDVRIDDGVIAAVAERVDANAHRVVDAAGLVRSPGPCVLCQRDQRPQRGRGERSVTAQNETGGQ